MKQLWFYFNTMQLADTYTEFTNVKAPGNVKMISDAYKDIINVQAIPPSVMNKFKAYIGIKTNTTSVSSRKLLAFPSTKTISITRAILGTILGCILAALVVVVIYRKRIWLRLSRSIQKQLRALYNRIVWNAFIRTLLQMFYPMILVSLRKLYESEKPSKQWPDIIKVVILLVFTIFTFLFMVKKREEVDDEPFKQKYGAYFTNIETYLKPAAVHYPAVFLFRRLLMALTITFLKFNLVTQVLCGVHLSLMMLSWLIMVRPFDSALKNYLENINEFLVLIMSYMGFLFSDYVESPIVRYRFGFFYLSLIALGLAINVSFMLYQITTDLLKTYRRWRHKKSVQIQQVVEQKIADQQQFTKKNDFFAKPLEIQESDSSSSSSDSEVSISQSEQNSSQSIDQLLLVPPQQMPSLDEEMVDLKFLDHKKGEEEMIDTRSKASKRPKSINFNFWQNFGQDEICADKDQEGVNVDDYPDYLVKEVHDQIQTMIDEEPTLQGLIFNKKMDRQKRNNDIEVGFDYRVPQTPKFHHRNQDSVQTTQSNPQNKKPNPSPCRIIEKENFSRSNFKQAQAQINGEIKEIEDSVMNTIAQADPLILAQIHSEEYLKKVKIKLLVGPSATISELLSEVREIQEQKLRLAEEENVENDRHTQKHNKRLNH